MSSLDSKGVLFASRLLSIAIEKLSIYIRNIIHTDFSYFLKIEYAFTLFFLSPFAASPTCIQLACLYLAVTLHRGEKSTEILPLKLLCFISLFSLVP